MSILKKSTSYSKKTEWPIDLLVIVTDTNNLGIELADKMQKVVQRSRERLFIDHHPSPDTTMRDSITTALTLQGGGHRRNGGGV